MAQNLGDQPGLPNKKGITAEVAEELPRALAAYFDQHEIKCAHEANFLEMHDALGNAGEQEAIRQSAPDTKHCQLLVSSPVACTGCPNNPYEKQKRIPPKRGWLGIVAEALELHDSVELGFIRNFRSLSPEEFMVVRVTHNFLKLKQNEYLGSAVGVKVAEILAQLLKK